MGRAKPLNGTVGATKKKLKEAKKKTLAANDTAKIQEFLNEAIAVCESGEYTVLTAESEE